MLMTILNFIWKWKSWLLVGILAITIGIQNYLDKKEALALEGVISSTGVDIMTCKGNLALCEQQFKNLAAQCKTQCPGMASDINILEKNYADSKKDLLAKQTEIKKVTEDLLKARQDLASAGKIVWAENPEDLQKQLKDLLGKQWDVIVAKIKKDSGINGVTATVAGITQQINHLDQTVKKFRYYPKLKLGFGTDLSQVQVQVGTSLFSYGKERSIEKTYLDFIEPFVGVGMDGSGNKGVAVGVIPISFNLGGVLPVIKDLDIFVGGQYNFKQKAILPVFGISSTF